MFSFDLPMVVSILDPLECDNPFTRRSFPGIVQLQGYRCRVVGLTWLLGGVEEDALLGWHCEYHFRPFVSGP